MKLVRFGEVGAERPGLIGADGEIRDLSSVIADISGNALTNAGLTLLRSVRPEDLPVAEGQPRLGSPVAAVRKFIGVGLNYSDHAAEVGQPIPREPVLFTKAVSCICGPNDDVILPPESEKLDWEVELAIVIGETARRVSEGDAINHVAGYCLCNDISERAYQIEGTGQWLKGKSCDTFGPLGPWLVTADEIPDPQALSMFLDVNGKRMQNGSTATMVFGVRTLVSFISRFMTLEPGDVITTGTPPGVALGMKEPVYLKAGDEMRLGVQGLGEQRQIVVMAAG
ncbi:MAG: fumarylacetoacetate hydrolase family protein [Hyphomicrobiales bacterium]|nr:fumarylacetoacetate hydrolase family protein [Hyphomicrobiales bacterium]